jgi:hypothetical protein
MSRKGSQKSAEDIFITITGKGCSRKAEEKRRGSDDSNRLSTADIEIGGSRATRHSGCACKSLGSIFSLAAFHTICGELYVADTTNVSTSTQAVPLVCNLRTRHVHGVQIQERDATRKACHSSKMKSSDSTDLIIRLRRFK